MKIGVLAPVFRHGVDEALDVARRAEQAGLDGVFVYDHLWPMGSPQRPALHSHELLAALAAETSQVAVGTLVARVGLVPDAVLVNVFVSLHRMFGDRVVAGLGTGDRLSAAENLAFGVPYPPAGDRLASLAAVCERLRAAGVTTWVGGRSRATHDAARRHAHALNLWGVDAEAVAAVGDVAVTWGGPLTPGQAPVVLPALRDAGATWAVCALLDGATVDELAAAAGAVR